LIVCANGSLGLRLVRWLRERGEELRGLVLHRPETALRGDEIIEAAGLSAADILAPASFETPEVLAWWTERAPELAVSLWSSHIFTRELIRLPPRGILNLHNSLLPHARGSGANVWTILDRLPGGVSLHYVTEDVDRGPIIAQRAVPVSSLDTGRTYFERQEEAMVSLFQEHWPRLRAGPVRALAQAGKGSFHAHGSQHRRRRIDLDRPTTAREVLDQLRAFTFPPFEGAWFEDQHGARVVVEISLKPASPSSPSTHSATSLTKTA
jgi:methionyl-tRNA formyltransferase